MSEGQRLYRATKDEIVTKMTIARITTNPMGEVNASIEIMFNVFFNVSLIAHKGINIFFDLQILVSFFCSIYLLSFGASRTGFYPSSHTRLCQLADFPSLILRSSFAQASLRRILNCGSASRTGKAGTGGGGIGT